MTFISACVIVRNEAENLPRWLSSARKYADEIIVVDTGSTDNSKEIAIKAGAGVFDFKWINDFSAAKNFALEQASGQWIAFLDADEYFDEASRRKVRSLLKRLDSRQDVQGLTCPLYNIDADEGNRILSIVVQLRLFRNIPYLRYEGNVHENIAGLSREDMYYAQELRIMHTGYSAHQQRQKSARNLQMLMERQAKEENPFDWHYMVDCFYAMGDYVKAAEYAQKILSRPDLPERDREKAWENWASSKLKMGEARQEVLSILDKGLAEFPSFNRLQAMKGLCLYEAEQYEEAARVLGQTLKLEEKLRVQSGMAAVRYGAERHMPYVHSCLGLIACNEGREDEALVDFLESLKLNRYQPNILQLFQFLLEKKGIEPVDQIELLNNLYNVSTDAPFLVDALEKNGGQVWKYYKNRL